MPGTITPAQMFDRELDAKKGWPSPYAVDKRVERDTGVTGVAPGMCLRLDGTTGKAHRGSNNGDMGLFAWQGENDFDVNGDVGNIVTGTINTLVAAGAYELETTEFTGSGFVPNARLGVENTGGANQGKLKVVTLNGADNVVGVCSEIGPAANSYGKSVIRFWPVYLPSRA